MPDPMKALTADRVVEITRALCASTSPDGTEERCARAIAELLDGPGVEVELDWVLPCRPNVIARVRGDGGPGLLLNGHLDASFHPGPWRHDPRDAWVEGARLYGGAVTDMLGGVAAMVAAVEAAGRADYLPGDLVFLGAMHHDTVGLGTKYALSSRPSSGWPRYGICGEPSSLRIQTANGGAVKYELTLRGRNAHVSRREDGADALAAAVEVVHALGQMGFTNTPDPRLPDLPVSLVGELHAGTAPGLVADTATVRGDVRALPSMTPELVRADLEREVKRVCPAGISWSLELTAVQRPFLGATSGPLIEALASAHRDARGREVEVTSGLPCAAFVTDAADMAAAGIETVVYGPGDWKFIPDESLMIEDLVDAARVYLATALRLN